MDALIDLVGLVGRDALLAQLQQHLRKGRPVLLTGPPGCGKSTLLRAVVGAYRTAGRPVLAVDEASPAKPLLLALAEQLHAAGGLPPQPTASALAGRPWRTLHPALNRLRIKELAALVLEALRAQPALLVLDRLDHVTPTQLALMHALMETSTVLGAAARAVPTGHLASLWWAFKQVEVPPLEPTVVRYLIDTYVTTQHLLLEQPRMFRRQVRRASGGNPRALAELLADAGRETYVSRQYLREEVQHAGGDRYLDLTPLALLLICVIVGSKYLARGLEARDMYIMAGFASAILMFVRLMLIRGSGRRSPAA